VDMLGQILEKGTPRYRLFVGILTFTPNVLAIFESDVVKNGSSVTTPAALTLGIDQ
jgi:hypothetical protein